MDLANTDSLSNSLVTISTLQKMIFLCVTCQAGNHLISKFTTFLWKLDKGLYNPAPLLLLSQCYGGGADEDQVMDDQKRINLGFEMQIPTDPPPKQFTSKMPIPLNTQQFLPLLNSEHSSSFALRPLALSNFVQ